MAGAIATVRKPDKCRPLTVDEIKDNSFVATVKCESPPDEYGDGDGVTLIITITGELFPGSFDVDNIRFDRFD